LRHETQDEAQRRARLGLPRGYAGLLNRLATGGPLRVGELATVLGVDNSTLTPQAQRLERAGLIEREPDPKDGRAAVLKITAAGKQLLNQVHHSRQARLAELLSDLPEADREAAAAALARLASAL
jgi:DNA-binding MarR family transcriptional regulator